MVSHYSLRNTENEKQGSRSNLEADVTPSPALAYRVQALRRIWELGSSHYV